MKHFDIAGACMFIAIAVCVCAISRCTLKQDSYSQCITAKQNHVEVECKQP